MWLYGSHVSNDKARFINTREITTKKLLISKKWMNKKNIYSLWPVLGLLETFLETVLFFPVLHDLLLLRGKVNGLGHWLHHDVCQNIPVDNNKSNEWDSNVPLISKQWNVNNMITCLDSSKHIFIICKNKNTGVCRCLSHLPITHF